MIPDYTIVVAIDAKHVDQFRMVWPTWRKNKPDLLDHEMLVICDGPDVHWWELNLKWLDHPQQFRTNWSWPVEFPMGHSAGAYQVIPTNPYPDMTQRERMLTAFIKVPPRLVSTPYWLKIDTDAVASAPGEWIKEEWFAENPALIASPWGYTKPGWMIDRLEAWAETVPDLRRHHPLCLHSRPGEELLHHPRIGSWLCFVNTEFSQRVAEYAPARMPVPSQDTLHWYCAARLGLGIERPKFKALGWSNWNTNKTREIKIQEALR